jgi:hypothetical protein
MSFPQALASQEALRRRFVPLAFSLWVLAHATALWGSSTAPDSAPSNPFVEATLAPEDRFTFEGCVEERIDTKNYRYLRVDGVWVVSLAATSPHAGRVRVMAVGRQRDFESRRLSRRFDVLVFGVVRAADAAESREACR